MSPTRRMRSERVREEYGSVRALPSGRFQARVPGSNGRSINPTPGTTYASERQAWAAVRAYRVDHERGLDPHAAKTAPVLRDWIASWLPGHTRELAPGTQGDYADTFKNVVLAPEGGLADLRLDEITPMRIRDWLGAMAGRHSIARRDKAKMLLGMALRAARREGVYTGPDPTEGVRVAGRGAAAEERRQPFYFYTAELVAIATAAHALDPPVHYETEDWPLVFETLMWSGIRPGELFALVPLQLLPEARLILVNAAMSKKSGEPAVRKTAKSAKWRYARVPGAVMDRLVAHVESNRIDPAMPVFSDTTGSWLHSKRLNQKWHATLSLAGIEADPTSLLEGRRGKPDVPAVPRPYDLRATLISHLLAAGVPHAEVRAHVGHEDEKVTDLYTQVQVSGQTDEVAVDARQACNGTVGDVVEYLHTEAWKRYG